ncbi:hypothetical protein IXEL_1 [Microbacterium phage Ixel]|nr:hypothetical protein IXEL_1 [Microbacterium phage Ixel]
MPSQPATPAPSSRRRVCKALTTSGSRCRRPAVPGLTVCQSHGGATAASARKSASARVSHEAATLWGISAGAGSISVEEELTKLARNKLADVTALRIKISGDSVTKHIGKLTESSTLIEYDIEGTVQSKSGTQETLVKRAGTSVWVQELHKAEAELLAILKLLQEVTGGSGEVDTKRLRMQTARETARLLKAFPGLSVDDVAAEVVKKAS